MTAAALRNYLLFTAYTAVAVIAVFSHELWGDELEAWCVIKASPDYLDLLFHRPKDAHPIIWNTITFLVAKLAGDPYPLKWATVAISCFTAFAFIFYSPFSITAKILTLSGYYFVWEFAAFIRGYMLVVALGALICTVLNSKKTYKYPVYYILLLLLASGHILSIILAVSFQFYVLYDRLKHGTQNFIRHFFAGMVILLPVMLFLNDDPHPGVERVMPSVSLEVPLRAFFALPAIWKHSWWNSHIILELTKQSPVLKIIVFIFSILVAAFTAVLFKKSREVLVFYLSNMILTMLFGLIFPLVSARYVGFLFCSFLFALWLSGGDRLLPHRKKWLVRCLLIAQIPGGIFALQSDIRQPFSAFRETVPLLDHLPKHADLITDYWGLSYLCTVSNEPFYCVESKKLQTHYSFRYGAGRHLKNRRRYSEGIEQYCRMKNTESVYFFTTSSARSLFATDSLLSAKFAFIPIDTATGSIERFSNIYLYQVNKKR